MARLNDEIRQALSEAARSPLPPWHTLDAAEARAAFSNERAVVLNPTPVESITDTHVATPTGDIPVRIYKPDNNATHPALIWFHGGGWVVGDLDTADITCRDLCAFSGCAVISVDYRLAPEYPFPAAFDDSLAVTQWVFAHAESLGLDDTKIAVGGDSAGGNLAACAALHVVDSPFTLCAQVLIYPVVECDFSRDSYVVNAEDFGLTTEAMQWFWDQYVPEPSMRADVRVNPLHADLSKLPPSLVLTVESDPLRDEGLAYAAALQQVDVPVHAIHSDDTIHGYFGMDLDCSRESRQDVSAYLRRVTS